MSRQNNTLITLGSNGGVSYQRLSHDDAFALVRDNEPELTQLFAEGRFDAGMFASDRHPLLGGGDHDDDSQQWLAGGPRRGRRGRRR
jgi:hypothetical protein